MRTLTNIRPVELMQKQEGQKYFQLYNISGVNLWVGVEDIDARTDSGIPVAAGASWPPNGPILIQADIWVGSDIDNTEVRYYKSKQLAPPKTTVGGRF